MRFAPPPMAWTVLICSMLVAAPSAFATPSATVAVGPEIADLAPRGEENPAGEASLAVSPADMTDPVDLAATLDAAGMVFDGVLLDAAVRQPEDTAILVTDYRFEVVEWLVGPAAVKHLTLTVAGGERPDGRGMTVDGSVRLRPQRRYLIVSRPDPEHSMQPIVRALQVYSDGTAVADEAGRVVVDIRDGRLVVRDAAEAATLAYLAVAPAGSGTDRPQQPPVGWVPPEPPATPPDELPPLSADAVLAWMAAQVGASHDPAAIGSLSVDALTDPLPDATDYRWCGRINDAQNYYAWVPDDDHWSWWGQCAGNWNTLVDTNPSGPDWLIGYYTSGGDPIRDRAPAADDGDNNTGVVSDAQLASGGYGGTWAGWSANGINFTWYSGADCTRITEVDTFVNPAIADDPVQHRKSLTHEMGHALGQSTNGAGGHEDRTFALMYPGTWRQPPNYSSTWYGRMDDMAGVRDFLETSNDNYPGTWVFEDWVDMATWSQTHDNWGSSGNLVMTDLDGYSGYRGDTVQVRHIQVENRGNQPASDVDLTFYLSTNTIISSSDYQAGYAHWPTFSAQGRWSDGDWSITVPSDIPAGTYYIGWILTLAESERTTANNTAIMVRDAYSSFSERTFTVLGQPDLLVPTVSRSPATVVVGDSVTIDATVQNDGDGSSSSSALRYLRSTNSIISLLDTEIGTDPVSPLTVGGSSNESITVTMSTPGTFWLGACVDTVSHEDPTDNQCSVGLMVEVVDPDLFADDFESGDTTAWSATTP